MKKLFFTLTIASLFLTSCEKEVNPFLISNQNIGLLTDSTQIKDLKLIFANDSIANFTTTDAYLKNGSDIEIFEKGGKKLLELSPNHTIDSTATIETIKIIDPRYKTEKGISTESTFGDIKAKHKISSIQNTLRNVVIFVNENNTFFTIDKKELPSDFQFKVSQKIEANNIPDSAKIKYFMVGWND